MIPTQPLTRVDILVGMFRRHTPQEQHAVLEALLAQPELAQVAREFLDVAAAGSGLVASSCPPLSVEDIW